jgi:hypothetical protein
MPSKTKGLFAAAGDLFLVCLWVAALPGATLYVSTEGNDASGCTENDPCLTISRAASLVHPGDVVRVAPGNYEERVTIKRGGSADEGPVRFQGHNGDGCPGVSVEDVNSRKARPTPQVTMKGFSIGASYVDVDCFEITGTSSYAVDIGSNRNHITVQEMYVHDGPGAVVNMPRVPVAQMPKHVNVSRNYGTRINYGFLIFCGGDCLVEDNELERMLPAAQGTGDMDYSRFFGEGITFRRNYYHGNNNADCNWCHIDCFQTFGTANPTWQVARHIVFDGNVCFNAQSGIMSEAVEASHYDWVVQNNIFRYGPGTSTMSWCALFRNIGQVVFAHNLCATGNVGYRLGSTGTHVNNIHFQLGVKPYFAESGSIIRSANNLLYANRPYTGFVGDLLNNGPQFANFTANDFRLLLGSPGIDQGIETDVKTDRFGVSRPQGRAPDIGPYELQLPEEK